MQQDALENESQAFRAGYEARCEGVRSYENPHHPVRQHQAFADWRDGWAERDSERPKYFGQIFLPV